MSSISDRIKKFKKVNAEMRKLQYKRSSTTTTANAPDDVLSVPRLKIPVGEVQPTVAEEQEATDRGMETARTDITVLSTNRTSARTDEDSDLQHEQYMDSARGSDSSSGSPILQSGSESVHQVEDGDSLILVMMHHDADEPPNESDTQRSAPTGVYEEAERSEIYDILKRLRNDDPASNPVQTTHQQHAGGTKSSCPGLDDASYDLDLFLHRMKREYNITVSAEHREGEGGQDDEGGGLAGEMRASIVIQAIKQRLNINDSTQPLYQQHPGTISSASTGSVVPIARPSTPSSCSLLKVVSNPDPVTLQPPLEPTQTTTTPPVQVPLSATTTIISLEDQPTYPPESIMKTTAVRPLQQVDTYHQKPAKPLVLVPSPSVYAFSMPSQNQIQSIIDNAIHNVYRKALSS